MHSQSDGSINPRDYPRPMSGGPLEFLGRGQIEIMSEFESAFDVARCFGARRNDPISSGQVLTSV